MNSICTSFSKVSRDVEDPETWSLLYYAFFAHRCAVRIDIDSRGKVHVLPFVNIQYDNRNAWGDTKNYPKLCFRYGSMENHYREKARFFGENEINQKGFLSDQTKWWLNGYTLCNVVPENTWSLRGLGEIEEMIQATASFMGNDSVGTYILNKRDSPILTSDMNKHCFPCLSKIHRTEKRMHPLFMRPTSVPLSFYVGPQWKDVPLPLPEAWKWSTREDTDGGGHLLQTCFRKHGILTEDDYNGKICKAVFRGSATGAGLDLENQRIKLCFQRSNLLDAGITAWNKRDRVIDGVVDFQVPLNNVHLVDSMTPKHQSMYKCIVYVDGHQASSRIIWHICSGSALILVDSSPLTLAPRIWIHDFLVENVHYVRVKSDLSNLHEVLQFVLSSNNGYYLAKNLYKLGFDKLNPEALIQSSAKAIISCKS